VFHVCGCDGTIALIFFAHTTLIRPSRGSGILVIKPALSLPGTPTNYEQLAIVSQ
jgi:hypothetical protein